jgi:2-phospho-L-lactate transferase/gluconeogenesis factor (CofD/UPF0052 family)
MMNGVEVGLKSCNIDLPALANWTIMQLVICCLLHYGIEMAIQKGLAKVGELLRVVGKVLPMALEPLDIEGNFLLHGKSQTVRGQIQVAAAKGEVTQLRLIPDSPKPTPEAIKEILDADWITFGPGILAIAVRCRISN